MPRFAANLSMMFTEHPFMARFDAAAAAGFVAVEFLFPYDYPAVEIRGALDRNGLAMALFNAPHPMMLAWPAGPRDSDGVWGAHWYERVNASTGFAPFKAPGPVPAGLEGIVAECQPYYEQMKAHKLPID